jgi:3-deoxy-D-manno-octulosonic-acid transferase
VPVLSVSGRIYPRDLSRYHAIRPLIEPTLRRLSRILAQNETERERFIALGAPPDNCVTAGNLKHLQQRTPSRPARLREQIGVPPGHPVIVFGSVHRAEIPLVGDAMAQMAGKEVRFVVAPRHLSSVPYLMREMSARGLTAMLRSRVKPDDQWRILVLDTIGELREFYGIAVASVICGGFGKFGGHNPLEALEAGTPVFFGAHFHHFEHEARLLMAATPEAMITTAEQIAAGLRRMLEEEDWRLDMLAKQKQTLPDPALVTRRYLDELSPFLTAAYA